MTTPKLTPPSHLHAFNFQTGRPRFHFDEAADGAAAAAASAAAAAAAAGAKPWHDGVEAEVLGHWQNKGWKVDDPKEVAMAATKQARELEKHFGVPADRLVKLPGADAKPEDIAAYHQRIGAPKEAKDYDLSPIKDPALADSLRAAMHERGVPKDAAAAIAATVAKAQESSTTTQTTLDAGKLAEEKTKLAANWKDKFDYNHLQAIEGARRLGITPEGVKALETQIGYSAVMEAMRKIGANTREDSFVERGVTGTGDVTTMEGAVARKAELMSDKAWSDRYLAGGITEKREMDRLNQMIVGTAA